MSAGARAEGDVHEATATRAHNNIGTLRMLGALALLFGHGFVLTGGLGTHDPASDLTREVAPCHLGLPGLGVAMFFAISGYLVTQSFVRRGRLLDYTEARLLRIYPALICAVALTLVLGLFLSSYGTDYATSAQTVAYGVHNASLFDLRYTLPGVFTENPVPGVNGSLWTLPVELRMYALVAIAGVLGVLGRRVLFNLALVATVLPLAWLSWHLVEAPALRHKGAIGRLLGRRPAAAQVR